MQPLLTPSQAKVYCVLTPEWQSTRQIVQAIYGPLEYAGQGYRETHKSHRRVHKQLNRLTDLGLVDKENTVRFVQYDATRKWMRRASIWRLNGDEK